MTANFPLCQALCDMDMRHHEHHIYVCLTAALLVCASRRSRGMQATYVQPLKVQES